MLGNNFLRKDFLSEKNDTDYILEFYIRFRRRGVDFELYEKLLKKEIDCIPNYSYYKKNYSPIHNAIISVISLVRLLNEYLLNLTLRFEERFTNSLTTFVDWENINLWEKKNYVDSYQTAFENLLNQKMKKREWKNERSNLNFLNNCTIDEKTSIYKNLKDLNHKIQIFFPDNTNFLHLIERESNPQTYKLSDKEYYNQKSEILKSLEKEEIIKKESEIEKRVKKIEKGLKMQSEYILNKIVYLRNNSAHLNTKIFNKENLFFAYLMMGMIRYTKGKSELNSFSFYLNYKEIKGYKPAFLDYNINWSILYYVLPTTFHLDEFRNRYLVKQSKYAQFFITMITSYKEGISINLINDKLFRGDNKKIYRYLFSL
ncbi:MAG: hypothetical protein HRS57_03830 [Mycoplasmataceae bacterium]|nr:hypothetical protein [Mycoplasmataceae bacterium]